jgi:hypothetical protein
VWCVRVVWRSYRPTHPFPLDSYPSAFSAYWLAHRDFSVKVAGSNLPLGGVRPQQHSFLQFNRVLLGNQAGRSVYKVRSLLHDVDHLAPFYIGGIDSGSKSLRITSRTLVVSAACRQLQLISSRKPDSSTLAIQ